MGAQGWSSAELRLAPLFADPTAIVNNYLIASAKVFILLHWVSKLSRLSVFSREPLIKFEIRNQKFESRFQNGRPNTNSRDWRAKSFEFLISNFEFSI